MCVDFPHVKIYRKYEVWHAGGECVCDQMMIEFVYGWSNWEGGRGMCAGMWKDNCL